MLAGICQPRESDAPSGSDVRVLILTAFEVDDYVFEALLATPTDREREVTALVAGLARASRPRP